MILPGIQKFVKDVAMDHFFANTIFDENDKFAPTKPNFESLFSYLPLDIVKKIFSFGSSDQEMAVVPFSKSLNFLNVMASFNQLTKNLKQQGRIPVCSCVTTHTHSNCRDSDKYFHSDTKVCDICNRKFNKGCYYIKSKEMVERSLVEETMKKTKGLIFRNFYKQATTKRICRDCEFINDVFENFDEMDNCSTDHCIECSSLPFSEKHEDITEVKHTPHVNYDTFCPVLLNRHFQNSKEHFPDYYYEKVVIYLHNARKTISRTRWIKVAIDDLYHRFCEKSSIPRIRTKIRNELVLVGKDTLEKDPEALERLKALEKSKEKPKEKPVLEKPTLAPVQKKAKVEDTGAVSPQYNPTSPAYSPISSDDSSDNSSDSDDFATITVSNYTIPNIPKVDVDLFKDNIL